MIHAIMVIQMVFDALIGWLCNLYIYTVLIYLLRSEAMPQTLTLVSHIDLAVPDPLAVQGFTTIL